MKHITPFFENEELLGDLRSMGYKDLTGRTINIINEGFTFWYLIVMIPEEETKAVKVLMKRYGITYEVSKWKNKYITTLQELLSYMHYLDKIDYSSLSQELKVQTSITSPQIVAMAGFNPYRVIEEMERLFIPPLSSLIDADLVKKTETITIFP